VLRPRGPPGSHLSPSTTLFRSGAERIRGRDRGTLAAWPRAARAGRRASARGAGALGGAGATWHAGPQLDGSAASHNDDANRGGGDRKSTRLNSSHVTISYAVFC